METDRTDTVYQTGNNITGAFTLSQTEISGNSSEVITDDQTSNQTNSGSGTGTLTITQSGNSVTGDFSISQTQSTTATTTVIVSNQVTSSATTTATDSQTSQQTGNNIVGNYSLSQTDNLASSGIGNGVDARGTFSLSSTGGGITTTQRTGNNVVGNYSLAVTQSTATTVTKSGHDQFNDLGSYYGNTETDTNSSTTTVTGNAVTGADTQSVTGTDTVSTEESGGNLTGDAPAYLLTQIDIDTSASGRTGNDITGTYTLGSTDTIVTTFTESAGASSGSYELDKNLTVTQASQETGNAITGDYTVTLTTENTEIDEETLTFAGGTAAFSTFAFDLVTQTQTGNHVTGNYALANIDDLHSSSLDETGTDAAGNFSLTETTSGTSLGNENGNEITGIYTTTDTTTDSYQATETVSGTATSFSLVETGSDTVTASATGNNVTGYVDQYDTVADSYTMNETGTQAAGAFDEVVTGSDNYRDQETGTPQQGNYSVYETGSGNYYRSYNSGGGTLVPGPGDLSYTLTETYSSLRGGINLTTVSGADRYSLLEQWQDLSASGLAGGNGVGTAEHQAYGVPVATVGWWNAPLSTKDGDPYGNSGDALKDSDYSGGGGGEFGRSFTDKLLDPIQEAPDQRGFWEKASEWAPGMSTIRDLGAAATSLGTYLGGGTAEESLQPMLQRMYQNGGMQSELADLTGTYLALRRGDYEEMERLGLNAVKKNALGSFAIGVYAYGLQEWDYQQRMASGDWSGAQNSRTSFWTKQIDKMVPFEMLNYVSYGAMAPVVSSQQRDLLGQLTSLDPEAARRGEAAVPATQAVIDVVLTLATLPIGGEGAEVSAGMRAASGEVKVGTAALREVGAADRVFAREFGVVAKEAAPEVRALAGEIGAETRALAREGEAVGGMLGREGGQGGWRGLSLELTQESRVLPMTGEIAARLEGQGMKVTCFAPETKLRMPDGSKPIIEFRRGDPILSAPEWDVTAPPSVSYVEEVFENHLPLLNLQVGGQMIRTTAEHPFYVRGKGWLAARVLEPGNLCRSHDGQWVAVEEVIDNGEESVVYNLRVSEYHTYFVGDESWGFSVWAHNACTVAKADPWNVSFSHPLSPEQLGGKFTHGEWAGSTLAKAIEETMALGRLPKGLIIEGQEVNGRLIAINNRTLYVAQKANIQEVEIVDKGGETFKRLTRNFRDSGLGVPVDPGEIHGF